MSCPRAAKALSSARIGRRVAVPPGRGQGQAQNDDVETAAGHATLLSRFATASSAQERVDLGAARVHRCARRSIAAQRRLRRSGRRARASGAQMCSATSAPSRATSTSSPGSRNSSMPSQASVIRQRAGARRLEHAGCRREAGRRHRVAGDVQNRERARVEGVVIARVDMSDVRGRSPASPCLPAVAADEEAAVRQAAPPGRGRTARRALRGRAGGCRGRRGRP